MKKVPVVLVSYAHDSDEHMEAVAAVSDKLVKEGVDCWIDQYVESPEQGWPKWMEEKVRTSDYVLVVGSQRYLERYEDREEPGRGQGVRFESILITQILFNLDSKNKKFIPVILSEKDKDFIPIPLQGFTRYNLSNPQDYLNLYKRITGQSDQKRPQLGKIIEFSGATKQKSEEGAVKIDRSTTQEEDKNTNEAIPDIPELTKEMKPALKLIQAFFMLPVTNRLSIAKELGLLKSSDDLRAPDNKLFTDILLRAKEQNALGDLWEKLFDIKIDPNPFK
jgi:hypothetical protein